MTDNCPFSCAGHRNLTPKSGGRFFVRAIFLSWSGWTASTYPSTLCPQVAVHIHPQAGCGKRQREITVPMGVQPARVPPMGNFNGLPSLIHISTPPTATTITISHIYTERKNIHNRKQPRIVKMGKAVISNFVFQSQEMLVYALKILYNLFRYNINS